MQLQTLPDSLNNEH